MAISYTDQPPGGAAPDTTAPPDATAAPTGRTPAPPYADIPASGATTPSAPAAAAPTGQVHYVDYDPSVGPSLGREAAAPVVSGLAGTIGGTLADLPSTIAEAAFINPARHMAHDIGALVSGEPQQQWATEAKDIEQHPLLATGWGTRGLKHAAETAGLPTIETAPAQTAWGRIAQRAGEAGIEFATPGIFGKVVGAITDALNLPKTAGVMRDIGEILSPGSFKGSAAIGATTGAVQQGAAEAGASPLAQKTLGLVTPMVAGAVPAAARAITGTAGLPLTATQQAEMATAQGREAFVKQATAAGATPAEVEAALRQGMTVDQYRQQAVPGSAPATTAEILNDPNLAALHQRRQQINQNMAKDAAQRQAESTQAQQQALQGMADPNADPQATQSILSFYRNAMDAEFQQRATASQAEVARTAQAAQPTMTPEEAGEIARGAVRAEQDQMGEPFRQAIHEASQGAQEALNAFGGIEPLTDEARVAAQERAGRAFREPAAQIDEAERQRMRQLREAIDPTNTATMNKAAIQDALTGIRRDFRPEFFSGPENNLYNYVDDWGDHIRLEDAFALRQEINSQLRNRNLLPNEQLRLQRLKKGIDQATDEAAQNLRQDQVTAREGRPETQVGTDIINILNEMGPSTISAYAQSLRTDPARMRRAMQDPLTAEILRRTAPEAAAAGAQTLHPMDATQRQQYIDWAQEYRAHQQRFRSETGRSGQLHAVGQMLEKGGAYDEYKLPDGRVPALFIEGKDAPQAIDRFIAAVGPEAAGPVLDDAFRLSLRNQPNIMNPNGTMNTTVYNKWRLGHRDAMSRRPELLAQFDNAAAAQQKLLEANQALAQHERDYPLKAGLNHSAILGQYWKPGPQGAELMQRYREITGNDAKALDAAADYAAYDFAYRCIKDGVVIPNKADTWISQHALALGQIPGLKEKFADAATAQRTFEDALTRHGQMLASYDKSLAGVVLGADINKVAERLFKLPNGAQQAAELNNMLGTIRSWRPNDAYRAQEGLKRAVIDHIKDNFTGQGGALDAQNLSQFINQHEPILRTLFGDAGWNAFQIIGEDARRASLIANAKATGPATSAEVLRGMGQNRNPAWWNYLQAYAFEHLGEHVGHGIAHMVGLGHIPLVGPLIGWALLSGAKRTREHLNVAADQALDHLLMHPEDAMEAVKAYTNPRKVISNPTMSRYKGRLLQGLIQNSEGHQPSIPTGYQSGGRVRLQGGSTVSRVPSPPVGIFSRGGAIIPQATPHRFH